MPYSFAKFINEMRRDNKLIVQPRMGFGTVLKMQEGLQAVAQCKAPAIGTITLDSYTRVNDFISPKIALDNHQDINGFPIVTHGSEVTRSMLNHLDAGKFAVQVRHGTALPIEVIKVILASGMDATEGGPISYCLPYSRLPLEDAVNAWEICCELLGTPRDDQVLNHLESFAGCMLGQLCPPSMLIALSILEGIFFKRQGIKSISLSYAQGPSFCQDLAALNALRTLSDEYFSEIDCHIVVYTYMGVFPKTLEGAKEIIKTSARLAKIGKAQRLIVKTPAEAYRIPTILENIESLEWAYQVSKDAIFTSDSLDLEERESIYCQAKNIINAVLDLHPNLSKAIMKAFEKGYLDVPYCLHPNNQNKARSMIDPKGYLHWADVGNIPFDNHLANDFAKRKIPVTSNEFLSMLGFVQNYYDNLNTINNKRAIL